MYTTEEIIRKLEHGIACIYPECNTEKQHGENIKERSGDVETKMSKSNIYLTGVQERAEWEGLERVGLRRAPRL